MTPDLVFGKYEIQHRLAIGGMGEVFYAMQKGVPGFERAAILKSLLPELAQQEGFIDQFLDEARVAATLNHPNVVSIYEVGMWNGTYFIAMEYIRGRNLSQLIRRSLENQQRVPPMVAARIVRDAALGLDHAHRAMDTSGRPLNIIHRDISPQNIMVRDDGVTKVVDFGIASASNRSTKTKTGSLKGKIAYMAPEQLLSAKGITPKVDQYALGVVFWEMLTGRRLFKADTQDASAELQVIKKVLEENIPKPSSLVREVPPEIDDIVMAMISRDPAGRFEHCAEAASAIDRVVVQHTPTGGESPVMAFMRRLGTEDLVIKVKTNPGANQNFVISLKQPGPNDGSVDATGKLTRPPPEPPAPPPPPKSKLPLVLGAAVLTVSASVGGYFALRGDPVVVPPPVVDAGVVIVEKVVVFDAGAPVKPGKFKFVTNPPGAKISFDGRPLGLSPQDVEGVAPNTPHYLQIEKAGFLEIAAKEVQLLEGEEKVVELTLEKLVAKVTAVVPQNDRPPPQNTGEAEPGKLTVSTTPPSRVFFDGQRKGDTPLIISPCAVGNHQLKMVFPDQTEKTETVQCKSKENIKVIR